MHGNKAKLKRPSLALLRCKMIFEIFELGLIAAQNEFKIFELGLIAAQNDSQILRAWPHCGEKSLEKFSSLALFRCKMTFEFFELALIAVQIGLALLPFTSVVGFYYIP